MIRSLAGAAVIATVIPWPAAAAQTAATPTRPAAAAHAPSAPPPGVAKPDLVLRQTVDGMPRGERHEVSVLTATLAPGDRTVMHTHRFPVTVYILQGEFTLEMADRPAVTVRAGESMVEPPHVTMTGYNRGTVPMKVVIFYVSEPGMPFLDPVHR